METKIKFVSLWLALVCVIVFAIQNFLSGFTELFFLSENALSMPWQFLTAVFLHGSIVHLLYNLFALMLFGLLLEGLIGSKKFFWFFIISGIFANVISFFWYPNALGASGAIMAVIGSIAVLRPMLVVWAFNLPLPMFVVAIIWVGGSILGIFGFGDQSTGYLAHLSGIVIGITYGLILRLQKKYAQENSVIYRSKIVLPEDEVRRWEDFYLKK